MMPLPSIFRDNPTLFIEGGLGVTLRPLQREVTDAIAWRRLTGERHTTVHLRTCHGWGKTFLAAALSLWFATTRENSRLVSTAPKWAQVQDLLWAQIRKLHCGSIEPLPGEVWDAPRWTAGPDWFATGVASDKPYRLEGHHGEQATALVVDEAKGVPDANWHALQGALMSEETFRLVISTPWLESGWFYELDRDADDDMIRRVYTIDDMIEQGTPGAVDAKRRMLDMFGGEDDPDYQARMLARYIVGGGYGAALVAAVDEAMRRAPSSEGRSVLALDPSRNDGDGDESGWAWRVGEDLRAVGGWHTRDLVKVARHGAAKAIEFDCDEIVVDSVGLGSGVVDILRAEGWQGKVREFVATARPGDRRRFTNAAAENARRFLDLIHSGRASLPRDPQLRREILQVKFEPIEGGKTKLDKAPIIRGVRSKSPNRFDAAMMAFSESSSRGAGLLGALEAMREEAAA